MQPVSLIGAPTDIGASARGASMGPEALRVAGLQAALESHGVDVARIAFPNDPPRKPDAAAEASQLGLDPAVEPLSCAHLAASALRLGLLRPRSAALISGCARIR